MKPLLLILALLTQTLNNPHIETRYDRFSDTTALILTQRVEALSGVVDLGDGSYYVKPGASARDIVRLHIIAVSVGKTINRDAVLSIALTSRSAEWVYLKQTNTLRMILDGTDRLDFGIMERTRSDVISGGVSEQLAAKVTLATIERLARASTIEVQIGPDEFTLTREQITDLRDFVSQFPVASQKPSK